MLLYLHAKNLCFAFRKTWKTSSWTPFGPPLIPKPQQQKKNSKKYVKKKFTWNLSLNANVTLYKTLHNFSWNLKKLILGLFWPLLGPNTLKQDFFQKMMKIDLKTLCCCNWCKKSDTSHMYFFHKTWKTLLWAHFGSLWPKTPEKAFLKKFSFVTAYVKWNTNFKLKIRKFLQAVMEKNSGHTDKRTNRQRLFHRTLASWVQKWNI